MGNLVLAPTLVSHLVVGGEAMINQARLTGQEVRTQCGLTTNAEWVDRNAIPCPLCNMNECKR